VIGQKILIYDWWKMSKAQLLAQVTALTQENDRLQKELDSIKSSAKTSEVTYRFIDF
jgi:cell shape-determining protein MreC